MIKKAIESEGVEEIFKLGDETKKEHDIFDEDYIAKINKIKLPNTKIKLLQKLLTKAIGEIKKVNKVKGIDFTKKMQALVKKYNERKENDILRSEVYEEMAEQLTNLIWEVQKEFTAGEEMGINFEEKAFYDILKSLCVKYDFSYPEDKLINLAKAVKEAERAKERAKDKISLLVFKNSESEYFAAPLNLVERIERIQSSDIEEISDRKVIQYRGGTLPLYELSQVTEIDPLPKKDQQEVIVFTVKGRELGLMVTPPVDAVEVALEIDDATLKMPCISGSMIIDKH
jgi:chemotaxis signal transduction protein